MSSAVQGPVELLLSVDLDDWERLVAPWPDRLIAFYRAMDGGDVGHLEFLLVVWGCRFERGHGRAA